VTRRHETCRILGCAQPISLRSSTSRDAAAHLATQAPLSGLQTSRLQSSGAAYVHGTAFHVDTRRVESSVCAQPISCHSRPSQDCRRLVCKAAELLTFTELRATSTRDVSNPLSVRSPSRDAAAHLVPQSPLSGLQTSRLQSSGAAYVHGTASTSTRDVSNPLSVRNPSRCTAAPLVSQTPISRPSRL